MEKLTTFITIVATGGGLLISTLSFLIGFIKNTSAKKKAQQIIEIGNAVMPFIKEAEKFSAYSGEEKKTYVMTKANQFAIDKGFKFDANGVSEKIEELVALTKSVNARTKDIQECASTIAVSQPSGILKSIM